MRKLMYLIAAAAMAAAVAILRAVPPGLAQQEPRPADAAPVPYNPVMGDLMSILIQPRHVKLWLAGQQENWALAGYALKEIKQSFARIAAGIPQLQWCAGGGSDRVRGGVADRDSGFRDQSRRAAAVRRALSKADRRMQFLPRHPPAIPTS